MPPDLGTELDAQLDGLRFSPNDNLLVANSFKEITALELVGEQLERRWSLLGGGREEPDVAFFAGGEKVAIAWTGGLVISTDVEFRRADDGAVEGSLTVAEPDIGIGAVAIDDTGSRLAVLGVDGRLWDMDKREVIASFSAWPDIELSPDGDLVAAIDHDRIVLFDTEDGSRLRSFASDGSELETLAFFPDGDRLITGHGDGTIRMWDTASGQQIGPTRRAGLGLVRDIAVDPSGERFVTVAGVDRGLARIHAVQEFDTDLMLRSACQHLGQRNLDEFEWENLGTRPPDRDICPNQSPTE